MTENQRRLKKLYIILLISTIPLVVISWLMLSPKDEGLCFNGVRDVIEDGIDCGGPCDKKCPLPPKPPQVKDIEVEWVKFIKDGENEYDLAAKLVNNNTQWGVSSIDYKFSLYDSGDNAMGNIEGATYIMPRGFIESKGEKFIIEKSIIKNHFAGNYIDIARSELILSNFDWTEFKDEDDLREKSQAIIKIADKKYGYVENGKEFYHAFGVTRNLSRYSFRITDIKVILFNNKNEVIAVGKNDQWTLAAGEGWEFEIFWLNPFSEEIAHAEYIAETNVFDVDNFMAEYGTGSYYKMPR